MLHTVEHAIGVHQCGEAEHVQIHFLPRDGEHADQRAMRLIQRLEASLDGLANGAWYRKTRGTDRLLADRNLTALAVRATDDHPLSDEPTEHLADEEGDPFTFALNALGEERHLGVVTDQRKQQLFDRAHAERPQSDQLCPDPSRVCIEHLVERVAGLGRTTRNQHHEGMLGLSDEVAHQVLRHLDGAPVAAVQIIEHHQVRAGALQEFLEG